MLGKGAIYMFTMFTSTKKEGIMKGQKRYHLLPYEKPKRSKRCENSPINSEKDLSKCRKTNFDMSKFG